MTVVNNRKRSITDKLFVTDSDFTRNLVNSYNLAEERPKTNLLMTVSYDGTKYCGFVGPCIFLQKYGIVVDKYNPNVNSISNEILRAMTLIHGYFGKGGKRVKKNKKDGGEGVETHPEVCSIDAPEQIVEFVDGANDGYSGDGVDDNTYEKRFTLITSSRTDKGVHSLGTACQYLSFDRECPSDDLDKIQDSLNRILPNDIRITALIKPTRDEFHVRHDNFGKIYVYKVDFSVLPSIFERDYYWQIMEDRQFVSTLNNKYGNKKQKFSFDLLREAANLFQGTYNFTGFSRKTRGNERDQIRDPVCTIERIDLEREDTGGEIKKLNIIIRGNRFLYKMIRCIVAHLILCGFNVMNLSDVRNALDTGTEIPNINCAPGHGLYLASVAFDKETQDLLDYSRERYFKLDIPSRTGNPHMLQIMEEVVR